MPLPQEGKKYTYADYLTWPEGERWEIIEGVPYLQAAPTWQHQAISVGLSSQFNAYLKGKPCRVFAAPFDLCIPELDESDEEISNIISQPDIVMVCDESKLVKFNRFEKAGVKEYWIVEPDTKLVSVFTLLDNNRYGRPELYTEIDHAEVSIFPDLIIDLSTVFNF